MHYSSFSELPKAYQEDIIKLVHVLSKNGFIQSISIFGSVARKMIHVGSDIDILIITKSSYNQRDIRRKISVDTGELKINNEFDLVIKDENGMNNSDPFTRNILDERVVLWEESVFTDAFKQFLQYSM